MSYRETLEEILRFVKAILRIYLMLGHQLSVRKAGGPVNGYFDATSIDDITDRDSIVA